jgi:D-alanyl-D-alanine dipeptidase
MVYRIVHSLTPIRMVSILFCFAAHTVLAQSNIGNKYGLVVIDDANILKNEIAADSGKKMADLKKAIPSLALDLKYAGIDNFMHRRLYPPVETTYLRLTAVNALKKAVIALRSRNLALKVFDAYRPYAITEAMWECVRDSRYAADPSKGSGHNRGIAIDLTLVEANTGNELDMGTGFDNFSDSAHGDFTALPPKVLANRRLLLTAMQAAGFVPLNTEWWHFSLPDAAHYELLDLSFDDLKILALQP